MNFRVVLYVLSFSLLTACFSRPKEFSLEPQQLDRFIISHPEVKKYSQELTQFYSQRNFRPAWVDDNGLGEKATSFLKRMTAEEVGNVFLPIYNSSQIKDSISRISLRNERVIQLINIEFMLTSAFFDCANKCWYSSDDMLKSSGWQIKSKRKQPVFLLDSLLSLNENSIEKFQANNILYDKLKNELIRYRQIQSDSNAYLYLHSTEKQIVSYLKTTGDLLPNSTLTDALKNFQLRMGLDTTGVIDKSTRAELIIPISKRIKQIELNMQRVKSLPVQFKEDNIVVNVPEYMMYVFHDDQIQWSCPVVVGTDSNNTVVFCDSIETVVFRPTWSVPHSIVSKETGPAVLKDPNYLHKHNMEVIDGKGKVINPAGINWSKAGERSFNYSVRQKSGNSNSLGKVKFLFPNRHSIYLHDTPAKSLFNESERAFSHGCIRIAEPFKLAQFVLRDQPQWTADSIRSAMDHGRELFVKLTHKIPVFLTYLTCWVNENGQINFRKDIYGQDAILLKELARHKQ